MKDKYNFRAKIDASIGGISQQTIHQIIQAWYDAGNAPPKIEPDIPAKNHLFLIKLITNCINNKGGAISHQAELVHLAMIFLNSSDVGKLEFLKILAYKFDIDLDVLSEQIVQLKNLDKDAPERIKAEITLADALTPPRTIFLQQLATLPNGFIFLKDMREFLLIHIKEIPRLKKLDNDIFKILKAYFDVNLLELKTINWETSATTLEHLFQYEAVHKIKSWKHLKHRLLSDHVMFGFFHPIMPFDPLIFVEVAFVKGLTGNIQELIELDDELDDEKDTTNDNDTAIFYSISSTQKGLRGISFGNFLIKQVVKKLSEEYPNIKTYSTLSPIPLLSKWLLNHLKEKGKTYCKKSEIEKIIKISGNNDVAKSILSFLENKKWHLDKKIVDAIKLPLMRLTLHFFTKEKRAGKLNAYDPVANFHLSNGAEIGQINWMGDVSDKGFEQSFGIMVNYRYKLSRIAQNHEDYMTKGIVNLTRSIFRNQIFYGI
ncbi:MAG: malonyl-CoA decarboxylase family protein [Bacteroidales bacterium]|nr:malonyl-CoA decarboxylase family protein [Bacteroidales bacterium]